MLIPSTLSALLVLSPGNGTAQEAGDHPLQAGDTRAVGGTPLDPRQQVDGTWRCGSCRVSAPLPAGYPPPTPPGALELKAYPLIRKAEATAMLGPEIGRNLAFWKLFHHIQSHEIAMTAPVEMKLQPKADDEQALAGWKMAFLYREPTIGKLGPDGEVSVLEDAPTTVLSIGVKGDYSTERALAEAQTLRDALAKLPGWRAAGPPRVLFYNGPDTRAADRWSEVQIPVERVPSANSRAPI